jgi:hypothetical protein
MKTSGRPQQFGTRTLTEWTEIAQRFAVCFTLLFPWQRFIVASCRTMERQFLVLRRGFMRHLRLLAVTGICIASASVPTRAEAQVSVRGGLDTVRFAQSLGVDLTHSRVTPSGAYWRELATGAGPEARRLSTATVRYRVARSDGVSVAEDSVFSFRLGAGAAMPGVDESVRGMKVGGQRQVVVPREAQGVSGSEGIPGVPRGEPVVFSVELVAVRQ